MYFEKTNHLDIECEICGNSVGASYHQMRRRPPRRSASLLDEEAWFKFYCSDECKVLGEA